MTPPTIGNAPNTAQILHQARARLRDLDEVVPALVAERDFLERVLEMADDPITLLGAGAGDQDPPGLPPTEPPAPAPDDSVDEPEDLLLEPCGSRTRGPDAPQAAQKPPETPSPPEPDPEPPPERTPAQIQQQRMAARASANEKRSVSIEKVTAALDGWTSVKDLAERTGLNRSTVQDVLKALVDEGAVTHNGRQARASRYRATVEPEPEPAEPSPAVTAATQDASTRDGSQTQHAENGLARARALAPPPSRTGPVLPDRRVSKRVRREVEREEAEAARAGAAALDNPDMGLDGRILHQLELGGPTGPRELSACLNLDAEGMARLVSALDRLVAEGHLLRKANPSRAIGRERVLFEVAP